MKNQRDSLIGLRAPEVKGLEWFNSQPLSLFDLLQQDKIILVDFWTYSCINCVRTIPHLQQWWRHYRDKGLVIIGVHSPEFEFEKKSENIQKAIKDLGIDWPVVNDANHETWQTYNNHYWPRHLLIDHSGKIVYDHIGEGSYDQTETKIQELLTKQGEKDLPKIHKNFHVHKAGSVCYPASPETYLGSARGTLKNSETITGDSQNFTDPETEQPGVALEGNWLVTAESIVHGRKTSDYEDYISLLFSGLEVNVVLSAGDEPYMVRVLLDGKPIPSDLRGRDISENNGATEIKVTEPRMYRLIKSKRYVSPGVLQLSANSSSFEAYVFTFSGCDDEND